MQNSSRMPSKPGSNEFVRQMQPLFRQLSKVRPVSSNSEISSFWMFLLSGVLEIYREKSYGQTSSPSLRKRLCVEEIDIFKINDDGDDERQI